jgi:hypothetical protein
LPLLSRVHWHHKVKVNVFKQTVPLPVQVRTMAESDSLRRREIISELQLVIFMNLQHHRGRFLENGVYPSKAMWVDFLAGISADSYWSVEDEAQKLNAIWYTLREGPDFICA